jgi:PhzF family phenazine biosynthesis protein
MKFTLYQVDAFTNKIFHGNPAAVVPLQKWLPNATMQALGMENNLSETVFFVPAEPGGDYDFEIRWFTPEIEIDLCGHATLASAYVLFDKLNFKGEEIRFMSKSGVLKVRKSADKLSMDFPAWTPTVLADPLQDLNKIVGTENIIAVFKSRDLLIELTDEEAVKSCRPDFTLMRQLPEKVIVTASGKQVDFVSRFFAPGAGVDEDPVTGSAHSQLIPYWAKKLNKNLLHAKQLSRRGGELWCELKGDRVNIAGNCVFFMQGEFEI